MYKYIYTTDKDQENHQCNDQHIHQQINIIDVERLSEIVKTHALLSISQRNNAYLTETNVHLTKTIESLTKKKASISVKLGIVRELNKTVEGTIQYTDNGDKTIKD